MIYIDKITRFKDIPQFVSDGNFQCHYGFKYLTQWLNDEISYGLQLNPNFQRGHVWTEEQQSRWIEYILRGGKAGVIYFNNPSFHCEVPEGAYNDYVCVDGLQRLTAIQKFMNNEIKAFGSFYNEYTDVLNSVSYGVEININDLKTEKEVLQWYVDMNSGGTPHTKEEIERVQKMIYAL